MNLSALFNILRLTVCITMAASVIAAPDTTCGRKCMTNIVTKILDSMVAHDPYTLPMAPIYRATENSHPAALSMMTAWRTITAVGSPSLLAIDVKNGTAYFALDISEGSQSEETILRARIAVVNRLITEIELFINRGRGDHGFSFSAAELPSNYAPLMTPPAGRKKATRKQLMALSRGLFTPDVTVFNSSDTCRFTELGWSVVDPGIYGNDSFSPGCGWPAAHPYDVNARVGLVVDEELGFVVQSGMIPGKVFAYWNVSAFIPDAFPAFQEVQVQWFNSSIGTMPLLQTFGATGETLEVLQFYDDEIQAMQINLYLSGPSMTSAWLS